MWRLTEAFRHPGTVAGCPVESKVEDSLVNYMDIGISAQGLGVGDPQEHKQEQDQPSDQTDRKDTTAADDENRILQDTDIDIEDGKGCCRYHTGLLRMNGKLLRITRWCF